MNTRLLFVIPLFILVLPSCKKEDENAPVIAHVHANGLADHHLHATAGTVNSFDIHLTDDQELVQMKIQFITPTGFHSHESEDDEMSIVEKTFQSPNFGDWDTLAIYNLNGNSVDNTYTFELPDTISGGWTMRIGAIDRDGNVAQEDFTLHVYNEDLPKILPDSIKPEPNEDGIVEMAMNESIYLYGDFVDTDGIDSIECTILHLGDTTWTQTIDNINNWTTPMEQFVLPPLTETGSYILHLHMWDEIGWTNWKQVRIVVE